MKILDALAADQLGIVLEHLAEAGDALHRAAAALPAGAEAEAAGQLGRELEGISRRVTNLRTLATAETTVATKT